jgi:predicted AlkP superfamily pyrophosphatase or phosphodiesterase
LKSGIFAQQKNLNMYISFRSLRTMALIALAVVTFSSCTVNAEKRQPTQPHDTYVIMLSMDGFRWDYAERVPTPNLDAMAAAGVMAEYLIPAFPTKTFPNHYTMATGLYPDNHGIVNNNFYCPDLDMTYRLGDRESVENGIFYAGEPIWVTAEKQGVTAASYFWVGSEAPVQGIQPTYWKRYDNNVPFEHRIDTVMHWLSLPEAERPRLITFYFNQPDSEGHRSGPDSPEVDRQVMYLDSLVGVLRHKLSRHELAPKINLIVTSDHGMTEVSMDRYVDLGQYVQRNWFEKVHGGNPLFSFQPKEGMLDSVYNILSRVENIYVWRSEDIPARFNYGSNPRVLDMVVLADTTWSVGFGDANPRFHTGGTHGWDNLQLDMLTMFYAEGPAFRQNHTQPPFEVVDLYPLIAHILGLRPAPVDGKLDRVTGMLR